MTLDIYKFQDPLSYEQISLDEVKMAAKESGLSHPVYLLQI